MEEIWRLMPDSPRTPCIFTHMLPVFLLLFLCLAAPPALTQPSAMERVQGLLQEIERGLSYVGQKAEQYIGPGIGLGEEKPAAFTVRRQIDNQYPVDAAPAITISNEFGRIQLSAWDERVVQVRAIVEVGAENQEAAQEMADAITVSVENSRDRLQISNHVPEMSRDGSLVNFAVHYEVFVPSGSSVVADNFFGDTEIEGISGSVVVEAQYGSLDLSGIRGELEVRMHGEFPLRVSDLAGNGAFQLHNVDAQFSRINGQLEVSNFRGSVLLRELGPTASVSIESDSGPIRLDLAEDAAPELSATVLFGEVVSSLPLTRERQGNKVLARYTEEAPRQRIMLGATFSDITINRETSGGQPVNRPPARGDQVFSEPVELIEEIAEGDALRVNAMVGTVRVAPGEPGEVKVAATRLAWVGSAGQAPQALRALEVGVSREGSALLVETSPAANMAELGASAYSVDLTIHVPITTPVSVTAEKGSTYVQGIAGDVGIIQASGNVSLQDLEGDITITNQNGNVRVVNALGSLEAVGRYGNIDLEGIAGKITTENVEGDTIVRSAYGPVIVRNSGGNARIMALEGVGGDYDVRVTSGNLRILLDPESDAALEVLAQDGVVYSALPLVGAISKNQREYTGRLGEGRHTITLQTTNGDIEID